MNEKLKLGTLPAGNEPRDAVHIAIVPCVAGALLWPGQQITLNEVGEALPCREFDKPLGVVDPFLDTENTLAKGDHFWLCLYPGTITSLNHVWEHPLFPLVAVEKESSIQGDKEESMAWLKNYVSEHCTYWEGEPDKGLGEFLRYVEEDRSIFYYGSDCHSLEDVKEPDELFRHLSIVLGMRIDAEYFEAFTCSC